MLCLWHGQIFLLNFRFLESSRKACLERAKGCRRRRRWGGDASHRCCTKPVIRGAGRQAAPTKSKRFPWNSEKITALFQKKTLNFEKIFVQLQKKIPWNSEKILLSFLDAQTLGQSRWSGGLRSWQAPRAISWKLSWNSLIFQKAYHEGSKIVLNLPHNWKRFPFHSCGHHRHRAIQLWGNLIDKGTCCQYYSLKSSFLLKMGIFRYFKYFIQHCSSFDPTSCVCKYQYQYHYRPVLGMVCASRGRSE